MQQAQAGNVVPMSEQDNGDRTKIIRVRAFDGLTHEKNYIKAAKEAAKTNDTAPVAQT